MEKRKVKLGDVILDATVSEKPKYVAKVTNKPVEKGVDISDHMKQDPHIIQLVGSMVDDAASKLEVLRNYQKNSELLTYHGRNTFGNVVLLDLSTDHAADVAKGFHYTITLQHVKISTPETFEVNVKNPSSGKQDPKTATQVKKKTNVGRRQPKTNRTTGTARNITPTSRGESRTTNNPRRNPLQKAQSLPSARYLNQAVVPTVKKYGNVKIGGRAYG